MSVLAKGTGHAKAAGKIFLILLVQAKIGDSARIVNAGLHAFVFSLEASLCVSRLDAAINASIPQDFAIVVTTELEKLELQKNVSTATVLGTHLGTCVSMTLPIH